MHIQYHHLVQVPKPLTCQLSFQPDFLACPPFSLDAEEGSSCHFWRQFSRQRIFTTNSLGGLGRKAFGFCLSLCFTSLCPITTLAHSPGNISPSPIIVLILEGSPTSTSDAGSSTQSPTSYTKSSDPFESNRTNKDLHAPQCYPRRQTRRPGVLPPPKPMYFVSTTTSRSGEENQRQPPMAQPPMPPPVRPPPRPRPSL